MTTIDHNHPWTQVPHGLVTATSAAFAARCVADGRPVAAPPGQVVYVPGDVAGALSRLRNTDTGQIVSLVDAWSN